MIDLAMLYNIIYALAARDGRVDRLFGSGAPLAHKAFGRSLAYGAIPEIWFELPLKGDPWFDLHVLTECNAMGQNPELSPTMPENYAEVFRWLAGKPDARQVALSYDVSSGDIDHPAVQLLTWKDNEELTCGFLQVAERADAMPAYRAFVNRIPDGWFACYAGVFPGRKDKTLRVECVVDTALQETYAKDIELLEANLHQVGFEYCNAELLERCRYLASLPLGYEFQFDVLPDGTVGPTFSTSVRFAYPESEDTIGAFEKTGVASELLQRVESWGLADDRWQLLADATFSKRVERKDAILTFYCYPAFIKLRWREGQPVDAKTYLLASILDDANA